MGTCTHPAEGTASRTQGRPQALERTRRTRLCVEMDRGPCAPPCPVSARGSQGPKPRVEWPEGGAPPAPSVASNGVRGPIPSSASHPR